MTDGGMTVYCALGRAMLHVHLSFDGRRIRMREPERWEREAKSRRGERTVSCQVSERYLSYGRTDAREISFGHPVVLRVMKDNNGDKPDRTLCELILSLEDLEVMVAQLRADITRGN